MKSKNLAFLTGFIAFLISTQCFATGLTDRFTPIVQDFENKGLFSGTLIARNGTDTFQAAVGLANDLTGLKNTVDTRFCIASNSKHFVAAAILKLEEQKKLSVDDPLTKYFTESEYPKKNLTGLNGTVVTIKHLLQHVSGIPDAYSNPVIGAKLFLKPISFREMLKAINSKKLITSPGQKWEYSNTGYILLGEIVRRQSGKTYSQYLQDEFFIPLGLQRTQVGLPAATETARAYVLEDSGKRSDLITKYDITELHVDDVFTDGNIYSTATDMEKWLTALTFGNILSKDSLNKMFTPSATVNYGFGLIIAKDKNNRRFVMHTGEWIGYQSVIVRYLDEDVVLMWVINQGMDEDNFDEFFNRTLDALF